MRTTAKDSDDDCVEVDGPQNHTGMSSHGTRASTRFRLMRSNDPCTRSHDGDGNLGTSSDDEDSYGTNHAASSAVRRHEVMQGSDGNPGTSGHDEDYSSYLTLMATLPDDFSDDEELKQAISASMESQM